MGHLHHHHGHHGSGYGYGYGLAAPPAASYPPAFPPPYVHSPDPYAVQPFQPHAGPLASYSPHHGNFSLDQAAADLRRHDRNEHMAEAGAVAAGAFAMYEAHKAKVDPLHAQRHKMEAGAAGAVALGSVAYALHERHEKKKDEHVVPSFSGHHDSHGHHHHHHQHKHGHF